MCATLPAFCEESNGDSESARRPSKTLKISATFNNLQSHIHLDPSDGSASMVVASPMATTNALADGL
eukprot:10170170-Heterocapsa_arctica.AAC.1